MDLAHLCELAILDSSRTGVVRMMGMPDFETALKEIRPSTGPWFDTARNVVRFSQDQGRYAELRA